MIDIRAIAIVAIAAAAGACTQADGTAARTTISTATTKAPSIDPQTVAIAKALLLQSQSGAGDRARLSQRLSSELSPTMIRCVAKSLAPYGKLTDFSQPQSRIATSRSIHTQLLYCTFLATFANRKIDWRVAFNSSFVTERLATK